MNRDLRFSLTGKNVAATSIVLAVVTLISASTGATFGRMAEALERHASTEQEQLMTSARLIEQAGLIAGLGMALARADSHDARRSTLIELDERSDWMDKLCRDLIGVQQELLGHVAHRRSEFGDNVRQLDAAISSRIDGDRSAALVERIRRLSERNHEIADELGVLMSYLSTLTREQLNENSVRLAGEARQQQHLLLQAGLLLLFVILSGLYVEYHLVRRIQRLQRAALGERIDPDQLQLEGNDELAQLAETAAHYVRRIQADEARLKQLNDELSFLAWHDPLTQLANRRRYDLVAARLLQRSRLRLCIALGDVDHFKRVNDSHGHAVGDRALRHVARQLQTSLRADDLIARFGGEEFALVLPVHDRREAAELLERVRRSVEDCPLPIEDQPALVLTISWGFTLVEGLPMAPQTSAAARQKLLETALCRADAALYQSKRDGRNRVRCAEIPLPSGLLTQ